MFRLPIQQKSHFIPLKTAYANAIMKMKGVKIVNRIHKIGISVILVIILCLLLSACESFLLERQLFSRFYDTDTSQAEAMLEDFLTAIASEKADAVKGLFSEHVQATAPNLDDNISALFQFFDGDLISYQRYGPGSSASKDGRSYQKKIFCSFDVTTTTGEYRIAFLFYTVNNDEPDHVGLASVYIIRAENSDLDRAYWGIDNENDIWKPGINIE